MSPDQFIADHVSHVVKGELMNLLYFTRGTETVEIVQERDPRLEG